MTVKCEHNAMKIRKRQNNSNVTRKINWKKVDKEWYSALTDTTTINLKSKSKDGETQTEIGNTILETCAILQQSASTTSSVKKTFKAKPKLKVWNYAIKSSLQTSRRKYKAWKYHGKPSDANNALLVEKKQPKRLFRKAVRTEIAEQRNKERELILDTKT